MQISATGAFKTSAFKIKASKQQGFTLLELLLVLFIIGMTSGLVVLTLPASSQDLLDKQARQLIEEFKFAQDLALNQHRLVGWQVTSTGYRFVVRTSLGLWEESTSRALKPVNWPQGLKLNGLPEKLPTEFSSNLSPALVFFPAGEVTSLKIELHLDAAWRGIEISANSFKLLDSLTD